MGDDKKTASWVTIAGSIIALVGVIATAYFGYLQVKSGHELEKYKFDKNTTEESQSESQKLTSQGSKPAFSGESDAYLKPIVEYSLGKYTGVHLKIANTSPKGIIVMSDLTLHWDYSECPEFREPSVGAPLIEYRYEVDVTKSRDSKILDTREFKYGPGDVDAFYVGINYPSLGVYHIWVEFKYSEFGSTTLGIYQTRKASIGLCEKW